MLPDGPAGSLGGAGQPGVTAGGGAGPHPWARRVMSAEETGRSTWVFFLFVFFCFFCFLFLFFFLILFIFLFFKLKNL